MTTLLAVPEAIVGLGADTGICSYPPRPAPIDHAMMSRGTAGRAAEPLEGRHTRGAPVLCVTAHPARRAQRPERGSRGISQASLSALLTDHRDKDHRATRSAAGGVSPAHRPAGCRTPPALLTSLLSGTGGERRRHYRPLLPVVTTPH